MQGPRNNIISGEAAQVKERTRQEISKNYFSQPLKSGEADASPASPVPRPLVVNNYAGPKTIKNVFKVC